MKVLALRLVVALRQSSQKAPIRLPFSPPGQCSVPSGLSLKPSRLRTRSGTQQPAEAIALGLDRLLSGSRMPIRLSASAVTFRHLRTLLVEMNSSCSRRSPMLLQAGQDGRYRTTVGSLLLFRRRLKAIGHLLAGSHRSFRRARATLQQGLRIECCNGRRRDLTNGRTGHGHSRHAVARLRQKASRAAPVFRTLLVLLRGRVLRQADRSGKQ